MVVLSFESSGYLIILLFFKGIDFPFSFYDQFYRNRLYASRRESRFYFFPQYRGNFKPHQTVENPAGLLGIHQILIDAPGILNRIQNRIFRDFMEDDPFCVFRLQIQHLEKMPGNSLSLAVLIGSEPNGFCFFGKCFQFFNHGFLIRRNFIFRLKILFNINAEVLFFQIPDMSETGFDGVTFAQEFFDGFGLCRRLNDNQIFNHISTFKNSRYMTCLS